MLDSTYAEHEKPAVADFKAAVKACGNEPYFVVVKRSCAFHNSFTFCRPFNRD